MALDKIWVFGEAGTDGVATITLEMLAKARDMAGTVEVFLGGDGAACAAELGDHGAATVYSTGDLGGRMQGVSVASAVAAAVSSGGVAAPDAFLVGTTYDGRDVAARLSVKLDASVLSNVVDLRLDGDALIGTEPVFGGTLNVTSRFTGGGPDIWLVRPKSFEPSAVGGPPAEVVDLPVPELGAAGGASGAGPLRRGVRGPEARRGRHCGLRWAGAGLRGGLLHDRAAGQGTGGRARG